MKFINTLLLACISTTAIADTTLVFTDKKNNESMKMQISGNKMRATSVDDNSSFMIYNASNTTFSIFNASDKSYFVMDKAALEALSDVGAMMDKMLEKQLAEMPAEQREMMRGMMSSMMKAKMPKEMPKPSYKFTGKNKSYNGFDCEVVKKKMKRNKSEFCVTNFSKIGMSSSEYSVINSFQSTVEKMSQQFGADRSMNFSSLGDYIPVQYKQAGESGTLSKVNHYRLDPSLFSAPAGYTRQEMPF